MRRPAQSPFGDGAVSVEVRILDESCTIGELDERVPPVYNLEHLARKELAHGASVGSVQESCTAELEGEPGQVAVVVVGGMSTRAPNQEHEQIWKSPIPFRLPTAEHSLREMRRSGPMDGQTNHV